MPDSMTNVLEVLAERKGKGGSEQISEGSREERERATSVMPDLYTYTN